MMAPAVKRSCLQVLLPYQRCGRSGDVRSSSGDISRKECASCEPFVYSQIVTANSMETAARNRGLAEQDGLSLRTLELLNEQRLPLELGFVVINDRERRWVFVVPKVWSKCMRCNLRKIEDRRSSCCCLDWNIAVRKFDCPTCSVLGRGGCSVTCDFGLHWKGSSLAS